MREHELFICGPLHGMGRPSGPEPAKTYSAEDDKGQTFEYRIASLVIAGQPRDVFVAEGNDLKKAQAECSRFAKVFK